VEGLLQRIPVYTVVDFSAGDTMLAERKTDIYRVTGITWMHFFT